MNYQTICPKCLRSQVATPHKTLTENSIHKCVFGSCEHQYKIMKNLKKWKK